MSDRRRPAPLRERSRPNGAAPGPAVSSPSPLPVPSAPSGSSAQAAAPGASLTPTAGTPRAPGPEAIVRGKKPKAAQTAQPSLVVGRIALLDADTVASSGQADALAKDGHEVDLYPNVDDGIGRVLDRGADIVVVDPQGSETPQTVVERLCQPDDGQAARPEVVVVTNKNDADAAVNALHAGAADYLVKPVAASRLRLAIARALERRRLLNENLRLKHDLSLLAAAQRLLETLDAAQLASRGVDLLASFSGASAAVLMSRDENEPLGQRGLNPAQVQAAAIVAPPSGFLERTSGLHLPIELRQFEEGITLDLGEARWALLLSSTGFSRDGEENALFLAKQLATAFNNGVRFALAEREARRDPLTGLWNARAFVDAAEQLCQMGQVGVGRSGALDTAGRAPFSVLFLDVDRFKQVNDKHGHLVGSQLLVELAEELVRCVREGDVVSRYGGDEFCVLLPEVDTDAAARVAERIRASVEAHVFHAGAKEALHVTVCIGVASWPRHGERGAQLLDRADRAMYVGKDASRNAVHLATSEAPAAAGEIAAVDVDEPE